METCGESRDSRNNEMCSENSSNSVDMCEPSQDLKKRKTRADCWEHFERYEDKNKNIRARCKHCGTTYAAHPEKNGTTSLNTHVKRCSGLPRPSEPTQQEIGFVVKEKDGENKVALWKFDQQETRKALLEMIVVMELSLSFVDHIYFKKFMAKAQNQFVVPSRRTITRDCFLVYGLKRQSLKKSFKDAQVRISLTTDTWTSGNKINYMCLTGHFIDKSWVLHKRILNFCTVSSHKGPDMACLIGKCLLDWGLENVFTVTVDNASSNNSTVTALSDQLTNWGTNLMKGGHLHMRCMAHVLNLIVKDGLKFVDVSIKRVRQMVKYIRVSPSRLRKFKDCCEVQKITCEKSLCLDVVTRWNSTYLMLDVAQNFEKAFSKYECVDDGLTEYLKNHACEDGIIPGAIESSDWVKVRSLVKFLKVFYDITLKVSGSTYVTSNVHFEEICELYVYLKDCIENPIDVSSRAMAVEMKKKFEKYWGSPENMNKIIFIASVLDPRNKFELLSLGLEEMFGKEKGQIVEIQVRSYMSGLFGEYQKSSSKVNCPSSPSSTSSDDSSSASFCSVSSLKSTSIRNKLQLKRQKDDAGVGTKTELDKYLSEEQEPQSENFSVLNWWKVNAPRFPVLSEMDRDVLAVPISSVASESAFSTTGRILDPYRSSLTPKLIQVLVCLQDWLRSEPIPMTIEEDFKYLEQLESELASSGSESCILDL